MRVIDLSKTLYSNMEVYEGDPQVKIKIVHSHEKDKWELRKIEMGSHTGTHVDAFSHMHKNKASLDEIPIERFFGRGKVVKVSEEFPQGIGLFFKEEVGLDNLDRIVNSNPGFVGGSIGEDLERALLSNEIITYTGLINLELIPEEKTFVFYGLPLKIDSGDGSPVRAIAIIED